jgi:hypothetical protein
MTVTTALLYAGAITTVKIGGTDIGGTYDGVSISVEDETFDLNVDQVKSVVDKVLLTRKALVTLNIAEVSLANFRLALAQASANLSGSTLYLTDTQQAETTVELITETPSGVGSRYYYFPRANIMAKGEHTYKKNEQLFVPVQIECLPDTANSNRIAYLMDKA